MKVALISHGIFPESKGGMERHTLNLATHLKASGVDVDVLVPEGHSQATYDFSVRYLKWPVSSPWLLGYYFFSKNVAKWIEDNSPDLVFSQGFGAWASLKSCKKPVLFHPHGLEMYGSHLKEVEKLIVLPFRWLVRKHGKAATRTISLGGQLTRILVGRARIPAAKIVEIPNAVEFNEFYASRGSRDSNRFLFVGRLAFNKGIDFFPKLMRLLAGEPITLTIVGRGPEERLVKSLVGNDERVSWVPQASDAELKELYRKHDCLLFSSRFEGMPTVILEAMAAGCCVIATDIGAVNVMVGTQNGILVQPDSTSIAKGIKRYLEMPASERNGMVQAAQAMVRDRFSWEVVIGQYLRLFEALVGGKGFSSG